MFGNNGMRREDGSVGVSIDEGRRADPAAVRQSRGPLQVDAEDLHRHLQSGGKFLACRSFLSGKSTHS